MYITLKIKIVYFYFNTCVFMFKKYLLHISLMVYCLNVSVHN